MKPPSVAKQQQQSSGNTSNSNKSTTTIIRAIESHDYHDYASIPASHDDQAFLARNLLYANSGENKLPFPLKLHKMLSEVETAHMNHVVSWQPHGRCFKVKSSVEIKHLLDLYFGGSKYSSFQRNLNIYGFKRITRGTDAGSYYHEMFLRGREHLCGRMTRTAVKGTNARLAGNPDEEPNFYAMAPVGSAVTETHRHQQEQQLRGQGNITSATATVKNPYMIESRERWPGFNYTGPLVLIIPAPGFTYTGPLGLIIPAPWF